MILKHFLQNIPEGKRLGEHFVDTYYHYAQIIDMEDKLWNMKDDYKAFLTIVSIMKMLDWKELPDQIVIGEHH